MRAIETAERQVEQLEHDVLAVAAGHYREGYQPGEQLPLSFSLSVDDRGQGGRSGVDGYPVELLTEAATRFDGLPDGLGGVATQGL